ncbi:MAG: DNA polymerase IV [bacterium]|nr:DNA polymerase IV [bacterium]
MQFSVRSFPRAILHVDGDAFFASCEVARNPRLRGKPVVTGKERNIAASMSYEAKRRGVTRGMPIGEIRRVCPDAVILPSDYETYSLYSRRMYEIVRRFTPTIEEYSIDECFADLTGLRRLHKTSYENIAAAIKKELARDLGMTFSVGLGPNKVIAKVASKFAKPDGFTIIPAKKIHRFLADLPVGKIWGIGGSTSAYLNKLGVITALDFASKDRLWIEQSRFSKPYREIWQELRGDFVLELELSPRRDIGSIIKSRTFTPPTADRAFVFSQLSKNIENACIRAREHGMRAKVVAFYLRTSEFSHKGLELCLAVPLAVPTEIIKIVGNNFDKVYRSTIRYRATGVVLSSLVASGAATLDLFGETGRIEGMRTVFDTIDMLDRRYGKHTVFVGSSAVAMAEPQHTGERASIPDRRRHLFKGESKRQHLNIPFLGKVK